MHSLKNAYTYIHIYIYIRMYIVFMEDFLKISGVVCSVELEIVCKCTKWGVEAVSRLYVEMMAYMYICMYV